MGRYTAMKRRVPLTLNQRDLADIVDAVCARHRVTLDQVLSRNRCRPVSDARAEACAELYQLLNSYPAVAEVMGLDHTSVMYARLKWKRITGDVAP